MSPLCRRDRGGATAGALAPVGDYWKKIRQVCDKHGVLLILDEVMSGMGRTGYLFACEEDGVVPDIMAIAKGLGAGYQPIGAMLASDRIYQAILNGSGFFQHGHTYMGHATACAGALAVQQVIEQDQLLKTFVSAANNCGENCIRPWTATPMWAIYAVVACLSGSSWCKTRPASKRWTLA